MIRTDAGTPADIERLIDDAPISGLQKRVIALCSLATFLDGYDIQALGLALPGMVADFGAGPRAFAAALTGSLAGMGLGAILLAPLADRYGRRRMLIAMLLLVGFSTLGAVFASSPLNLALWRILTGLGIGASVPVAMALTSEYSPARHRTRLITLMVVCTALGSFAAGFVAPWVEASYTWRGIFGLGALLPVLAAALFVVALPESLRMLVTRNANSPDVARLITQIAPAAAGAQFSVRTTPVVARTSIAGLLSPTLRRRSVLLWIVFVCNLFVNYSLISWLPTLLTSAGWAHATAQRATGLLALGGIAGGLTLAWLADKGVAVKSLTITYLGAAVVLGLFMIAPTNGGGWLALIALIGVGAFGAQMALGSYCAGFYPPEIRSTGLGWASGIGRGGAMLGPLALAGLMGMQLGTPVILGLLMIPMFICACCIMLLPGALR